MDQAVSRRLGADTIDYKYDLSGYVSDSVQITNLTKCVCSSCFTKTVPAVVGKTRSSYVMAGKGVCFCWSITYRIKLIAVVNSRNR